MLKKKEREKLIFEINVTPLTDVMLVLLIIFMVTTPFIIQGSIKINLPSAHAPADAEVKNVVIGVASDGSYYLNGARTSEGELAAKLRALLSGEGEKRVVIEGDKAASHGSVVRIMGIAREAGAEKMAVSTIPDKIIKEESK